MTDSRHVENRQIAISDDDAERVSQAYRPDKRERIFKMKIFT